MTEASQFVSMTPVTLNGQPQASTGAIQPITVTNARGNGVGWNVTGFVTDFGAPGGPTITLPTGQTIPNCSAALASRMDKRPSSIHSKNSLRSLLLFNTICRFP